MRSLLVFVVMLVLSLSPVGLAEDLPGTAYDESDTQPYEFNLANSYLTAQPTSASPTALSEAQAGPKALLLQTSTPPLPSGSSNIPTDAPRFNGARSLLAQVCTLHI